MRQLLGRPFRPSLARRIVFALLAAFLLVFTVLAAKEYWAVATDDLPVVDRTLKNLTDSFAKSFEGI